MKKNVKYISLFASLLLHIFSYSQQQDYTIKLKSGHIQLSDNILEYNPSAIESYNGYNYLLIQFNQLPDKDLKQKLTQEGIELINYIPSNSYLSRIPVTISANKLKDLNVRSYLLLDNKNKMDANLFYGNYPNCAKKVNGYIDVNVLLFDNINSNNFISILDKYNSIIITQNEEYNFYIVRIPEKNILNISNLPYIMWMEAATENFAADNLPGKTGHRSSILNDGIRQLAGQGIAIGEWDSGDVGKHVDLYGRYKQEEVVGGSASTHSTHIAGTIVGAGLKDPNARGMAPNAFLYGHVFSVGNVESELQNGITNYGMVVGVHSYGHPGVTPGCQGDVYDAIANVRDGFLNSNPNFVNCYSAGNYQQDCSGGYFTTNKKSEKNTITVGAVNSTDVMTTYSGWGPVNDSRLKPDLVGVGDGVNSTYPNHNYSSQNGTSFSTPGVAGVAAQLIERYRQLQNNQNPRSILIKGVLCNTAKDLGNAGPDYKFGYGRINALRAVRALEENRYKIDSVTTNATKTFSITVPANTKNLKVMLTWNDPAASPAASPALVNDIDLSVVDPSVTTILPWVLDGANPSAVATKMIDNLNNIEQVTISNPVSGSYQIKVFGKAVAIGNTQSYAVTWEMDTSYIEVVYPAGNEKLKNGVLETIRWDKEGVTGNQTVEYSADSGATWTVISSSVAAGTSHYNWSVPNIQTSKALIRVSSGSLSDVSDLKFTIIGVPANLAATDDPCGVKLTWNTVTGATGYDVLLLDTVNGIWNVVGSNVSATNFVVGGLLSSTRYWFTVRATKAAQNIIGQRATAINKVNNNAGVAPTITANANVLSTQSAASYQWLLNGIIIPGATSQNYAVLQAGYYSVTVTYSGGCSATSQPYLFVFTTINDTDNTNLFSVYPNPSSGIIQFDMKGIEGNSILAITNSIGQQLMMMQFETADVSRTIDLSKYDKGIYFITLVTDNKVQTKRVIIN